MPRGPRLDAPGVVHHIMVRGIEQREVFQHDDDRADFIRRLARLLPDTQTTCLAWCVLPNHVHLALRSGPRGLQHLMRRLLTGYAVAFNRRHSRAGHLFQNRYQSIVCEEDPYLPALVRYVHLTPIRAGIVNGLKALAEHPWSGHATLMGRVDHPWQEAAEVLARFGDTPERARSEYAAFVAAELTVHHVGDALGPRTETAERLAASAMAAGSFPYLPQNPTRGARGGVPRSWRPSAHEPRVRLRSRMRLVGPWWKRSVACWASPRTRWRRGDAPGRSRTAGPWSCTWRARGIGSPAPSWPKPWA